MDPREPDGHKTGASPHQGTLRSFFASLGQLARVFLEFLRLLAHQAGFRRSWQDGLARAVAWAVAWGWRALGFLLGLLRAGLEWLVLTGMPWLGTRAGRGASLAGDGLSRAGRSGWRGLAVACRTLGARMAALCGRITFAPGQRVGDRGGEGGLTRTLGRHPLLFGGLAVLAAGTLALLLYLALSAPRGPRPGNTLEALANATHTGPSLRREVTARPPAYEEYGGEELEERVKQTDLVILDLLRPLGPGRLSLSEVAVRRFRDRDYHFQALRLAVKNAESFLAGLREGLARHVPNASVQARGKLSASVLIDGQETHRLSLSPSPLPAAPPARAAQVASNPRLAIVIDDLGEDQDFVRGLVELPLPVAFSVWPDSSHAREAAKAALSHGRDLLVHQPMEPRGYPKVNPGKNPLLTSMSREQIQALVKASLDKAPGAKGLNNHMGSRFTENGAALRAALEVVKARGLFYLDSVTTGQSAGKREAAGLGLAFYSRDVFLDDVARVDAVAHQLALAERLALTTGRAIAIGHPYPETLSALKAWAKTRDARVAVVAVSGLPPE
jgi:polysaccharide deacetylase 2 family uncharacterized protein YibQ